MKVLLGSPVRATPSVLAEFLLSLSLLESQDFTIDFCFVDDNIHHLSTRMMRAFLQKFSGMLLTAAVQTDQRHKTPEKNVIQQQREQIRQYAAQHQYDRVLLLDCNFLLHPKTIVHLAQHPVGVHRLDCIKGSNTTEEFQLRHQHAGLWLSVVNQETISSLLQQEFTTNNQYPLVCIATDYGQNRGWERWHNSFQADKSKFNAIRLTIGLSLLSSHFYLEGPNPQLQQYVSPQLWKIITQRAGKNQRKLFEMLSISQCFSFFVASQQATLEMLSCQVHINKKYSTQQFIHIAVSTIESEQGTLIDKIKVTPLAEESTKSSAKPIHRKNTSRHPLLIASLIIRNESEWFLERMLKHLNPIVDGFVIIDDDSDDNSASLCRSMINKNLTLVELKKSLFHQEYKLRRFQWELTQAQNPEWILCLDADEFFEDRWRTLLPEILSQKKYNVVGFRKYDMWNETHYRDDDLWNAHRALWPHLVRNIPQINNRFQNTNQHCGRIPIGYDNFPIMKSVLRIKHYGSASPKIRERKYQRYSFLDPDGTFGNMAQYKSLMDENPNLVLWK